MNSYFEFNLLVHKTWDGYNETTARLLTHITKKQSIKTHQTRLNYYLTTAITILMKRNYC